MKRALMLSTALGVGGGAEEQVMLLSLGLHRRGWTVKIVSLLPLFPISKELEDSGIPISSLQMKRGIPDPRAIWALLKELRAFRPQVVHAHMPQANLLARAVRPFQKVPRMINTLHNLTMERMNGSSGRMLERAHGATDKLCDLTTVICTPAIESYARRRALPPHKAAVVYNGVNTSRYQPDSAVRERLRLELGVGDEFVWLAVGRFEKAKDYGNMLDAFALLKPPTKLLICGQGSLEAEIRAKVAALGLAGRVRFLGVRRDIPAVMNAADGFVMSSYLEGLPMVLLQASSIGMPIVATGVGGNSEVVLHSESGFVVPARSPVALADAMHGVLELSADERSRMAERGRQHIRKTFDIEQILDQWEKHYGY